MKKYLSIIILIATTLSMTSCLKENYRGLLDNDEAYGSKDALRRNTVAILYNYIGGSENSQGLQGTKYGVYDYNTFTADDAIIPIRGGDWYDGGFWQNLYLHTWSANDTELYDTWNYLYKVVSLSNHSLHVIDLNRQLLTTAEYQAATAEVRALRAMFYFYIFDMFGNVPLVTADSVSLKDVTTTPRPEVYRWAFSELQQALPYLPQGRSNQAGTYYGRLTQPVACFLLAKLAINAEIYDDSDWTDGQQPDGRNIFFQVDGRQMNAWQTTIHYVDLLEQAGYRLEDNEATNFAVNNEVSRENIFTIPMDPKDYTNKFFNLFRSRHYAQGSAIGADAENGSCATIKAVRTYGYGTTEVDSRFKLNFWADTVVINGSTVMLSNGQPLVYQPLEVRLNLTGSPYEKTGGARMAKYEQDLTAYDDGRLQHNDIVLFRYADALLMRAEAKVRLGEDGSSDLNAIRRRAGSGDREATLDNILQERLMELQWEGWRRNDLIRYRLFNKAYDLRPQLSDEASAYTTVFPIPQKAIDLNDKLQQNPGYRDSK